MVLNLHYSLCYFNCSFIRTALLPAVFIFHHHCHDTRKTWEADEKQGKYKKAEHEQSRLKCVFWGKISQISAKLKSLITLPMSFQEEKRRCRMLLAYFHTN